MTTQNWPQDPLVPSTTGNEGSTADLTAHELGTSDFSGGTAPVDRTVGSDSHSDGSSTDAAKEKASVAKDQAKQVGQDGAEAAKNVAGTAASEAKSVAAEAGSQARNLFGTVTSEVKSQAGTQQQKISEGVRTISDELKSMAEKSDNQMVAGVVRQASERTDSAASWLENRDASGLLEDVKAYARRKPGTFLALAAGTGLVVGRLTRGLTADRDSSGAGSSDITPATKGPDFTTGSNLSSSAPAGYTDVDPDLHSGTSPAFVDPADDYPTIPPGTPPVGTLPNDGSLR